MEWIILPYISNDIGFLSLGVCVFFKRQAHTNQERERKKMRMEQSEEEKKKKIINVSLI